MVAINQEIESSQPPIFYLQEKTGETTSDLLTASLIEELTREYSEQEMTHEILMGLIEEKLTRLGYNPNSYEKCYSGLTYNINTRIASVEHAALEPLSPTKGKLLEAMIKHPEEVIPRDTLLNLMGFESDGVYERQDLKSTMSQLRKSLRKLYGKGGEKEFNYPTPCSVINAGIRLTNQVPWRA